MVPPKASLPRRRTDPKSRRGCRNCKLRRVKCDEEKPACRKCIRYGVRCNFDSAVGDLQLATPASHQAGAEASWAVAGPSVQRSLASNALQLTMGNAPRLTHQDMSILSRFQHNTALTLGSPKMVDLWGSDLMPIVLTNEYLLHGVLATSATHDRYLNTPIGTPRSAIEVYHSSKCVTLFNQKLQSDIRPGDYDALWATAALLGPLEFASADAPQPSQAWPLRQAQEGDLEWITISEGKTAIWDLTDPLRPGSVFASISGEYATLHMQFTPQPHELLDPALVRLCRLQDGSNRENNAYYVAVHILCYLQSLAATSPISIVQSLTFLFHLQAPFKSLLRQKDPAALLILALWYIISHDTIWWLGRRARMECCAIRTFLETRCGEIAEIQELLPKLLA